MIIINSDDFAASKSINRATYLAFKENLISSTTALVNFEEGLNDAIKYVESGKIPKTAIGIHLNLTEGVPLTECMRKNDILCEQGVFKGLQAIPNFVLDAKSKRCVYEELNAQITYFIEKFGFLPSHIDSHQHVHTKWSIIQVLERLAKQHGIRIIRISRNIHSHSNYTKKLYKLLFNNYLRLAGFKGCARFGNLDDVLKSGIDANKTYEIMVHANLSQDGNEILDMDGLLLCRKIEKLKKDHKFKIINFRNLHQQ